VESNSPARARAAPDRVVLEIDHRADLAAGGRGVRGAREPFVQCAALVDLEVAPADPAKRYGIDETGHRLVQRRKRPPHAGVEQQRLIVRIRK
jgi:hypothetical protein